MKTIEKTYPKELPRAASRPFSQAEVARLAEMLSNADAQGAGDATVRTLHDDLEERERLLQELTKSHGQQLAEAKRIQAKRMVNIKKTMYTV